MTGLSPHSHILLIGAGKMGSALLQGWIDKGAVACAQVSAVEPKPGAALKSLQARGVCVVPHIDDLDPAGVTLVVLAVKPQVLQQVVSALPGGFAPGTLFVSIAAGQDIAAIKRGVGRQAPVVRVMPNTPATIGQGVSVFCASPEVTDAQRAAVETLLGAVGTVYRIEDERLMDAVTALSGSGPAYVFLLIEAMARGGAAAGLPAYLALDLARDTVAGAALLARQSGEAPDILRANVTSPGGTTAAALDVLMKDDAVYKLFEQALAAATRRGRELNS